MKGDEWWTGKDVEGIDRGLILRCYPSDCLEGLRKTAKNLSQDSLFSGLDLNPASPKYEARMSVTVPWRSVWACNCISQPGYKRSLAGCGSRSVSRPRLLKWRLLWNTNVGTSSLSNPREGILGRQAERVEERAVAWCWRLADVVGVVTSRPIRLRYCHCWTFGIWYDCASYDNYTDLATDFGRLNPKQVRINTAHQSIVKTVLVQESKHIQVPLCTEFCNCVQYHTFTNSLTC
jgi:hypothetical protein